MGQKNISGWDFKKQQLLADICFRTGESESEAIRSALGFYEVVLDAAKKFREWDRATPRGRPQNKKA